MRRIAVFIVLAVVGCGGHNTTGNGDDAKSPGDSGDGPTSTLDAPTVVVSCPNCPTFPVSTTPTCTDPSANPTLVYPPDKVLVPPNMNVIDVQFLPGAGNTLFEVDFSNAVTDVHLETQCTPITNTRGTATGGCELKLDVADWNFISQQNRNGDPVTVTVRGTPDNQSCVAGSTSRQISFAQEDMKGGIYYWQSVTQNGVAGKTGGIFRKDFGNPDPTPEPFLTPTSSSNQCVGCHYLSRDGLKMIYGSDDADSDDELGDDHFVLLDVTARTATAMNLAPGFAAWSGSDHTSFLLSDGAGKDMGAVVTPGNGMTGVMSQKVTLTATGLTGKRITNPDWTRDGNTVYFTATTPITGVTGYNAKDDIHAMNGSIWSVSVTAGAFGTPSVVVNAASADENNYYPTISPDGSSLIFDRATGTTLATHDSYNNPNAALFGMAVGHAPVALARANYKDGMTNSWPRFSPFVQTYQGKHILWVTFSSTRDYGLIVQNENPPTGATVNCYPPVSPEDPSGDHAKPFAANCTQPQIWMAAITLEDLANGVDASFPAFWLPFQDQTAHNHIAQWVDAVVMPPPTCSDVGQSCVTQACCSGLACDTTTKTCDSIIF